jgi:homocysteine S-methyltransferase
MNRFVQRLAETQVVLLDGATGTELERHGVDTSTPIWSALALLEAPNVVEKIHREYLEAGAEVVITNTFRTHRRNLERVGMGNEAARLTTLAVAIAQKAVQASGKAAFVAGSISPLEDSYSTSKPHARETYLREHTEMAGNLAAAGVDLLIIETMKDVNEASAASEAARATGLPFGVSFICEENGNLLSGEDLGNAVEMVSVHRPNFVGINCTPAHSVSSILSRLLTQTGLPLSVYANPSHTQDYEHWHETEANDPDGYAHYATKWVAQGAKLIGGCCGTQSAHIAALADLLAEVA